MRQGSDLSVRVLMALMCVLLVPLSARAVIVRLTALEEVLAESTFIVAVKVERLDPARPGMVLAVEEALKGKPTFKKLAVLLQGDTGAIRRKEPPQLLRRLADNLPLLLFISQRKQEYTAFAYTNGTWFSVAGTTVDGEVRLAFAHLEPYLRRTYAGTTAEMRTVVRNALSGKGKPPPPDRKAKPGLGPEVAPKKSTRIAPDLPPRRAVIPTVIVGGPLALLAMLFPAVFGGWKRWLALLAAAGTTTTLVSLQWWYGPQLIGSWLATPAALWVGMTGVNVWGMFWAWQRHLQRVQIGDAPLVAGLVEVALLWGLTLAGVVWMGLFRHWGQPILSPEWWPVAVSCVGIWAATLYITWTWLRGPRLVPAVATEAVVLLGLVLASVVLAPELLPRSRSVGGLVAGETAGTSAVATRLVWTFRLPDRGAIASTPVVMGSQVLVAAAHDSVFRPHGALYCLDRDSGKVVWTFDSDRKMKQVFSTPTVVGDRIYIGEGFHQDLDCKVYCLSARTGEKIWEFQTASHTESTPVVVNGRVYIGAGDDGLYCLDAEKGTRVWNFPGFHIDASPLVSADRLYVGCGIGDAYRTTALFCLEARTGKPVWRHATDLPVWTRPVLSSGFLYNGAGNGRLNESDEKPAGVVECLAADSGSRLWKRKMPDGVHGRLALDRDHLFVGCRDGGLYCLRRTDGETVWRRDMGGPVVSSPVLEVCSCCEQSAGRVYAASIDGRIQCLEPSTGKRIWSLDLVERTKAPVEVISTPALDVRLQPGGIAQRRLYIAATIVSSGRAGELLCYEEVNK